MVLCETKTHAASSAHVTTVMVIDDDDAIRELLAMVMEGDGHSVLVAHNGQEALDILVRHPRPALILLDMRMPVMDGWAFTTKLREMYKIPPPVVIVVTAAHDAAKWADEIGAEGYLAKPFRLQSVRDVVHSVIGRAVCDS